MFGKLDNLSYAIFTVCRNLMYQSQNQIRKKFDVELLGYWRQKNINAAISFSTRDNKLRPIVYKEDLCQLCYSKNYMPYFKITMSTTEM